MPIMYYIALGCIVWAQQANVKIQDSDSIQCSTMCPHELCLQRCPVRGSFHTPSVNRPYPGLQQANWEDYMPPGVDSLNVGSLAEHNCLHLKAQITCQAQPDFKQQLRPGMEPRWSKCIGTDREPYFFTKRVRSSFDGPGQDTAAYD
ncbi:hypothetical protein WMY93_030131 [Mugilogobius chulae]|uniref:Uncharacterized protein n=1 Tax=Mugilogobius chulae TaxID=88201 RepID=A0AAW0MRE4_9GOBI